jgi:hypothetical protein
MNPTGTVNDHFELLSILLLYHGSRGHHLLFKYPFENSTKQQLLANKATPQSNLLCSQNYFLMLKFKTKAHQLGNKRSPYSLIASDYTHFWIAEK